MPRLKANPADRWERKASKIGYVENRRGYCYMRYCGARKACAGRLLFIEENKVQALRELEVWIKTKPTATPTGRGQANSETAFEAYWSDMMRDKSVAAKNQTKYSFAKFFPEPFRFSAREEDASLLEHHIRDRFKALSRPPGATIRPEGQLYGRSVLKPSTVVGYASRMEAFLDYCLARRWIYSNPFKLIARPPAKKRGPAPTYSLQEFVAILAWFDDRDATGLYAHHRRHIAQYRLFWIFLLVTGMRVSEALALKWSEFATDADSSISVRQIAIRNTKTSTDRFIPLTGRSAEVARIRKIIAELRPYNHDGYVFPWKSSGTVRRMISQALTALGIPSDGKPVHKFRATAEEVWRKGGMDPMAFTKLTGHSFDVYKKHYESQVTADEVEKLLDRQKPPDNGG